MLMGIMVWAVPAKRGVKQFITLSDGTTCQARLVGDEFGHFWVAEDGRGFQKTTDSEYFSEVDVEALKTQAQMLRAQANAQRMQRLPGAQQQVGRRVGSIGEYKGAKKALVILVNYTDVTFNAAHDNALYQRIANEKDFHHGSFVGSMYDYFYVQSEGQFELTFDVLGPVTVSQNQAYYGSNDSQGNDLHAEQMVHEAIELVKDQVTDWKQYDWDGDGYVDQVYVIYAGNGESDSNVTNSVWPHAWSLSSSGAGSVQVGPNLKVDTYACGSELNGSNQIDGIGTMCHEFSHCLGYPDFYDTDYSGGQGMDEWDLMCGGSYNGNGYRPAGYTSYERWMAGWKDPIELNMSKFAVENMKGLQDGGDFYVMYNDGHKDEYFLLENRTLSGWDLSLPGSGLLIIHVDYNASIWAWNRPNDDPNHQRMTWIPSDGSYNFNNYNGYIYPTGLQNDTYPNANGNNAFNDTSSPAAELYNSNSDGTKLLHKGIKNITKHSDGTISFDFAGSSTVMKPEFSPMGGVFIEPQTVSISCATADATIYYTTDGTEPTTASNVYSEPLNISVNTTIKAMAATADDESWVVEATYTFASVIPTDKSTDYAWKEDFTGVAANTAVEQVICANAAYVGDNGAYCLVYDESLAGGTAPELLVPNRNRPVNSLTANIAIGKVYGNFELSFKSNQSLKVTSATTGVVITSSGSAYRYNVYVPENTSTLQLTFTNTNSQDARLDDIVLMKPPKGDAGLSYSSASVIIIADQEYELPTLINPYNLPIVYLSSDPTIATVDALTGVVLLTGNEGATIIKAEFEGDDDYKPAETSYSLMVGRYDPQLSFEERTYTAKTMDLDFQSPELINGQDLPVTYESYDTEVAIVDVYTGKVTIGKPGYTMIVATFTGNAMFAPGDASYKLIVEKREHGLAFDQTEVEVTVGAKGFDTPKLSNPNKLKVTYSSSDETLATVDEQGYVMLGAQPGQVTITASTDGDEYHEAGEASYQITLVPGTGISTLTSEQAAGEWYTIQGVRVDKSAKGIYIYGNKKVVK
jgi:M6 family metalloprotease-like protein